MTDEMCQLLDELDHFDLIPGKYLNEEWYCDLSESSVRGKITALTLSLDRAKMTAEAAELRELVWERGELIQVLEILKASIVPRVRAALIAHSRHDPEVVHASAARFLIDGGEYDAASTLLACKLSLHDAGVCNFGYLLDVELESPRSIYELLGDASHHVTNSVKNAIQAVLPSGFYIENVTPRGQVIEIDAGWRNELLEIARGKTVHNQATEAQRIITWNNHRFRSQAEIRLATALEKAKVLFFPNCKARLGNSKRENREPDFLVCYQGKWGILEVDGEPFHPPSRTVEDHERDRLFLAHGVKLVQHFDAGECWENAQRVVQQFLYLLEKA